jgi:hypothetical protein
LEWSLGRIEEDDVKLSIFIRLVEEVILANGDYFQVGPHRRLPTVEERISKDICVYINEMELGSRDTGLHEVDETEDGGPASDVQYFGGAADLGLELQEELIVDFRSVVDVGLIMYSNEFLTKSNLHLLVLDLPLNHALVLLHLGLA